MEKLKKIKELLNKLPGVNSPEPKYKKVAVFLYCFVLFLWIFAVLILYINSITDDSSESNNSPKIISFDEIKIKNNSTPVTTSSRESIVENSHNDLLMNAPSTRNDYKMSLKSNSIPLGKNNDVLTNSRIIPFPEATEFDKIIIGENALIKNETIIEDSPLVSEKILLKKTTVPAGLKDISQETKHLTKEDEISLKILENNKNKIYKPATIIDEKSTSLRRTVKTMENSELTTPSQKNKSINNEVAVIQNSAKQAKKVSMSSRPQLKKKRESLYKKKNSSSKSAENQESGEKKVNSENQNNLNDIKKNSPLNELNDPSFLPTNLKNKSKHQSVNNSIEKKALTSGMKNYTDNKDVIIGTENKIADPDLNKNGKTSNFNELNNAKNKGSEVKLMKYGELEYEPLKK
ncbi:MAG TPA: hypothetical protein PKY81_14720 [bacterium]|nr:hypothetical protein [bacterium]HPN32202.1 hypothetical protein [bacterium]